MNQLHARRPPKSTYSSRRVLAITDVAVVALAWVVVLLGLWLADPDAHRASPLSIWLLVAVGVTATVLYREQLYLTQVLAIRAIEVQRLGRTCLIAAMLLIIIDRLVGAPVGWLLVGIGSLISYALLLVSRAAFQPWLHQARRGWDQGRSLLVVAEAGDARRTLELLRDRPELGYQVIGYVAPDRVRASASASEPTGGDPRARASASEPAGGDPKVDVGVPWLGTPQDLALVTQLTAATGVLIVGGAVESEALSATVSELRALDVHVHLIVYDTEHHPSIRMLPLRHRAAAPAVDEPALSSWQRVFKRAFDVVAGGILALVTAPVVLLAAALLKVSAGGPVLVRDMRLGPGDEPLIVRRLRTNHLPPRRLARWVGRICRRLCIDELPQLTNVLAGSMSLVGPRPYRPGRPDQHVVPPIGMSPGLIGLRHVEALDYPEQGPHRRLDHFYAENWSIGLDLSILAASATHVLWRSAREAARGDEHVVVG